jgi:hypothetical protein
VYGVPLKHGSKTLFFAFQSVSRANMVNMNASPLVTVLTRQQFSFPQHFIQIVIHFSYMRYIYGVTRDGTRTLVVRTYLWMDDESNVMCFVSLRDDPVCSERSVRTPSDMKVSRSVFVPSACVVVNAFTAKFTDKIQSDTGPIYLIC